VRKGVEKFAAAFIAAEGREGGMLDKFYSKRETRVSRKKKGGGGHARFIEGKGLI